MKLREFSGVDLFKPKVRLINLKIKVLIYIGSNKLRILWYLPLVKGTVSWNPLRGMNMRLRAEVE